MLDPKKKLKGKTILVTGGAGFIGSHLVDRLLAYGARVVVLDDLSTGKIENLLPHRTNKKFAFEKGDVNKLTDLTRIFKKYRFEYVFHYAALVGVKRTEIDPFTVLKDIDGIRHILELSHAHKVKKIVYASSSEVYGNQERMPLNEERSYMDIRFPYAMVKSAGENYFRTYWEMNGLATTILRFFNVYGPRQESSQYGFVTGIFISQVLQSKAPTIFFDGTQSRDFMYIDDNIEASIQALINPRANGQAINLGTGVETTIIDLAYRIIRLGGKAGKLQPSLLHKRKTLEIERRVADNTKMLSLLGYAPRISLDEGLKRTYEWYKRTPKHIKHGKKLTYSDYAKRVWIGKKKRA